MSTDQRLAALDRGEVFLGPESLHIDITNGCNTNCVTCWDHSPLLTIGRTSAWKRQRVSLAEVCALLDDVISLGGLRAVVLSGMGEPFTHPDVYALIEAVKSRGLHLTMITNLIPADASRVIALGVDQLLIGVHGATETSYRAFHPSFRSDEWQMLHAMLARFRAAGRRYKHVQVIARCNAHELVEMVRMAHTYEAAQVNFKLASLGEGTESAQITEDQRTQLLSDLLPEARALSASLGVVTNLDVFESQLGAGGSATANIAEIGCFMGHFYARVLVDGTVLYCCSTEVRVGHLRDAPFSAHWRGDAWNALRARLRRGDYFASCHQCGKLNQNVKLAARFAKKHGAQRLAVVTGRAPE